MNKIVVVSDTHRNNEVLDQIQQLEQADYYLHAGDSGVPEEVLFPYLGVRGNCDWFSYPNYRIIEIGKIRILITHGHLYFKTRLLQIAKQEKCSIVITGHTHIPSITIEENIYFCNPGSPVFPRGKSGPTYARIIIDDHAVFDIQLVQLEGKNERK